MSQQQYKGCSHENRFFLITYKPQIIQGVSSITSPRLVCQNCKNNPDFVNDSVTELIFNIETGELVK